MAIIRKFDNFISETSIAQADSPMSISTKPSEFNISKESAAQMVVDRLSRIYKDLTKSQKKEVDKYFE